MTVLLKGPRWRLAIAALFGVAVLLSVSSCLSSPQLTLKPVAVPGALASGDYHLEWQSVSDDSGRTLLPDEVIAYSDFLRKTLSGQLAYADPSRVEDQARKTLSLTLQGTDPRQSVRLQSQIRPKLVLRNHSLAVFEVDTDYLHIRYSHDHGRLVDSRIKTMTETIRVADTRLGLVVRHVEPLQSSSDFIVTNAERRHKGQRLGGINYYPASAPWIDFWVRFPVEEIAADFAQIKALGANSVRIFLTRKAFEDPERREQSLRHLIVLLDLAQAHDLQVILTCFDMGVSYELVELTQSWAHLQRILDVAGQHPAVALIDLKNEPDLDYTRWGAARVDLWLSTLLQLAQARYPDLAFTVGWSNAGAASALAEQVDIVSFHDFEAPYGLAERIDFVRKVAGGKPIMLTEIGHSRWPSLPGRKPQADKLSAQLSMLEGLDGVLVWTLNDFDQIPDEVAGWRPWRKAMQAHYGLSDQSREHFTRFLCDFLNPSNQTCTGDVT